MFAGVPQPVLGARRWTSDDRDGPDGRSTPARSRCRCRCGLRPDLPLHGRGHDLGDVGDLRRPPCGGASRRPRASSHRTGTSPMMSAASRAPAPGRTLFTRSPLASLPSHLATARAATERLLLRRVISTTSGRPRTAAIERRLELTVPASEIAGDHEHDALPVSSSSPMRSSAMSSAMSCRMDNRSGRRTLGTRS